MRCSRLGYFSAAQYLYRSEKLMFDPVKFGVSDFAANKEFFLKALEPLGVAVI